MKTLWFSSNSMGWNYVTVAITMPSCLFNTKTVLILLHCSQTAEDVRLAISQKLTSSWSQSGNTYYRYAASITNRSPHQTLTAFDLSIQELYGPLWGLSKPDVNNLYSFPKWLKSLPPGKSMDFVYIQAAPPAIISLPRYHMIWSTAKQSKNNIQILRMICDGNVYHATPPL